MLKFVDFKVASDTKKQLSNTVVQQFCSYLKIVIHATLTKIFLLPTAVGGRFVVWLPMIK